MGKRRKAILIICYAGLLFLLSGHLTEAQVPEEGWSVPYRLSSENVGSSEGYMLADSFGYVHVFWVEQSGIHFIIQYARFNGEMWSEPVDIYVAPPNTQNIGNVSPAIDKQGVLYLVWTQGTNGPVYITSAPAHDALSAHKWSTPTLINIPAFRVDLQIDSKGVFHIIFTEFFDVEPGMYYVYSEDQGKTWSFPTWLDPDIPLRHAPSWFDFAIDEVDNLHLIWSYMDIDAVVNTWVRYAHSLDGGTTWSVPFTIDEADEGASEVRMPDPNLILLGNEVHAIWAGTEMTNREHRYSTDRGNTWGDTKRIFGSLQGQALGDGTAVDALNRIHFASHIRYPSAIWHAYWDKNAWVSLAPIDIPMAENPHYVRLAISADNKLVMSFKSTVDTDAPLLVMYRDLDDISFVSMIPTPIPTPVSTLQPSPMATAVPATPIPEWSTIDPDAPTDTPGLGQAIWVATALSFTFVSLIVIGVALRKRWTAI